MAVRCILTLALWCSVAPARASPRTDPTSGRAVFTGATMAHATSIELDPAALGLGQIDEVYAAITSVIDQLHIDLDPFDSGGLHAPGARVRDVEVAPGAMLAFIYHLAGDRGTVGFAARTNPSETFPSNRSALAYHTLGGGERDWLASAGASIRVTNELYFGASLSHQNTFLRLRYARDTGLTDPTAGCNGAPCGLANPLATESYDVNVRSPTLSTSNLRVNVGVVVQLARDLWLGVAYHTPPESGVQTELTGHVDVVRAPRDVPDGQPAQERGQSVVEVQYPASLDAELRARLPYQLDLHVAGSWEDLSRLSAYDVRIYQSAFTADHIPEWTERPRGTHDAFAVWGGVEQVDGGPPHVLYGGRLGLQSSSVTAARTSPLTIAPTSFTVDLGARRRFGSGITIELSYGLSYFPTVHGGGQFNPQDSLDCIASSYDYATPQCQAVRNGYAIAPAAGSYERLEHALHLGLRYELP